jgi:hypothetical protein
MNAWSGSREIRRRRPVELVARDEHDAERQVVKASDISLESKTFLEAYPYGYCTVMARTFEPTSIGFEILFEKDQAKLGGLPVFGFTARMYHMLISSMSSKAQVLSK